ncbi:hypothetical protein K1719_045656 [Acacia pycnantha]|nr:hypothetical protein K1719_045656 [Acacia pycnantha]
MDVYTIEFQKRGLPHAHIILWLSNADKLKTPFDVDQLISAEIPNKELDPQLYELVGSYMVHGPCGRSSRSAPCMKDGKCSKFFPKRYCQRTTLDENGYPTYRRRDDGCTVSRKGVQLDNRFVVPYNARLLKLFCGHLNIEKTNQSRAIKYLFKYVSKEYLNAIKCSGIPHHKLVLKVGVPIMLLRNIDQAAGLCNGTRLQIKQLGKNVIKEKALNGTSIGEDILIHRMDMNPSEAKLPFTMTRRQFP